MLMQPGHGIKRAPSTRVLSPAHPSAWDNRTDLAEKADTAMYQDDEDRLDAADQLAEHTPHAAAEAFSAIACDRDVGDEVGTDAVANGLAHVGPVG